MRAVRSERHIEDSARIVLRLSELAGSGGWRLLGHGITGARVYAIISSKISVGSVSRPCAPDPGKFDCCSVLWDRVFVRLRPGRPRHNRDMRQLARGEFTSS